MVLLLALAALIAFSYLKISAVGYFKSDDLVVSIILIVVFIVCWHFIHIVWHELGHLFFGLMSKFRCYSFSIGCFTIRRTGISLTLKNHYGSCVMIPKTADCFYRHCFTMLLGGILFSLALFAAGGIFMYVPMGLSKYAYLFMAMCFPVSGYIFAKNILPFSSVSAESDGAKLSGILHKSAEMQLGMKLFTIQCMLIAGTDPRNIPREMYFDVPVVPDNMTERILLEDYRYLYYLDTEDYDNIVKSAAFLQEALDDVDEYYYKSLLSDIFFCALYVEKNTEKAEAMYDRVYEFIQADKNISNLRIRMCHELYAEKKPKIALMTGRDALALADDFIISGIVPLEKRLIAKMTQEAEQQREEERKLINPNTFTEYQG